MKVSKKYVYPKLPSEYDLYFIRLGGSGLANCMFVAARGYAIAKKNNVKYINPTWPKLSLGSYIRKEKDKRHYFGLFNKLGISGFNKLVTFMFKSDQIEIVEGIGCYFVDLLNDYSLIKEFVDCSVKQKIWAKYKELDFDRVIGVHVRLGDYISSLRTNIDWYKSIIEQIDIYTNHKYKFWLFSDGTKQELCNLLSMSCIERRFFGNALADIIALSKTQLIIGSDSTFTGWSAFIGQVPVIFPKRHFGRVLIVEKCECVLEGKSQVPETFLSSIFSE